MDQRTSRSFWLLLWDALAWITIIFPVLTGGLWYHRPGLKIELTQINAPVALLTLFALILFKWKQLDVTQTTALRSVLAAWRYWKQLFENKPRTALLGGCTLSVILLASVALRRHSSFETSVDMGIFTNVLWNVTHGYGYYSSLKNGVSLFADHQSPILLATVPFFAIFPRAETLLVLQSLGLALGAIPVYWIARQYLPGKISFQAALPLIYWSYLPMRRANAFDFHPEIMLFVCFLGAIACLQELKWKTRLLGFFLLLAGFAGKESAGPLAVGLGIAWLLGAAPTSARSFTRKVAFFLIPAGLALFVFDTRIVPQLVGSRYSYTSYYADFGANLTDLFLAPFTHTKLFFSRLFGITRLNFLWFTMAPLALLPLFGWRQLLMTVPCYIMLFLAAGDHRVSTHYYYGTEASIGLFWATAAGIAWWLKRSKDENKTEKILLTVMTIGALFSFGRSELFHLRYFSPSPHMKWVDTELVPAMNPRASVTALSALVPHLAARHWVQQIPNIKTPQGTTVDCILYDSDLNQWPLTLQTTETFLKQMPTQGYREVYRCETLTVFQFATQDRATENCLLWIPQCPSQY